MGREQYDSAGQMTGTTRFFFRPTRSTNSMDLSSYDSTINEGSMPLAIDAASDQVYLLRKVNGRDALYRQRLEPGSQPVGVASNPNYDIDGIVRLQRGGPVVGYSYTGDRPETVFFDPAYTQLIADLGRVLKDETVISISATSHDGNKVLVYAASDNDPGAYYVSTGKLERSTSRWRVVPPLPAERADGKGPSCCRRKGRTARVKRVYAPVG